MELLSHSLVTSPLLSSTPLISNKHTGRWGISGQGGAWRGGRLKRWNDHTHTHRVKASTWGGRVAGVSRWERGIGVSVSLRPLRFSCPLGVSIETETGCTVGAGSTTRDGKTHTQKTGVREMKTDQRVTGAGGKNDTEDDSGHGDTERRMAVGGRSSAGCRMNRGRRRGGRGDDGGECGRLSGPQSQGSHCEVDAVTAAVMSEHTHIYTQPHAHTSLQQYVPCMYTHPIHPSITHHPSIHSFIQNHSH